MKHQGCFDKIAYMDRMDCPDQSFVFSVPTETSFSGIERRRSNPNRTVVLVSMPIWVADDEQDKRARTLGKPVRRTVPAVVALQIRYNELFEDFVDAMIFGADASDTSDPNCMKSETHECFVIDDGGYVVLARDHGDVGQFFGKIRPTLMHELLNMDVYVKVPMTDYQGVCPPPSEDDVSDAILSFGKALDGRAQAEPE